MQAIIGAEINLVFYSEIIDEYMILEGVDILGNLHWTLAPDSVLRPTGAPDRYADFEYEGVKEHNLNQDWVMVCNL